MEGVALKKVKLEEVDSELCIICQKTTKQKTTSIDAGHKKIIEVAKLKNDVIHLRIQQLESGIFYYHMSYECYKKYVHFMKLATTSISNVNQNPEEQGELQTSPSISRQTRSMSIRRESCNPDPNIYQSVCVICGCKKHKGKYEKFRICEADRAKTFLSAALFFQDQVYTRICDLEDVEKYLEPICNAIKIA